MAFSLLVVFFSGFPFPYFFLSLAALFLKESSSAAAAADGIFYQTYLLLLHISSC